MLRFNLWYVVQLKEKSSNYSNHFQGSKQEAEVFNEHQSSNTTENQHLDAHSQVKKLGYTQIYIQRRLFLECYTESILLCWR
jgi:hypothetical protein